MPRPKREQDREATARQIKAVARRLMAEKGSAGLSMRAIAREMKMTAPALYYYFASMDDLITALILDAFNALADQIDAARQQHTDESYTAQMMAAVLAYRQYALDHPADFQLIYGSPIPGYAAPRELTVPASSRTLIIFVEILQAMLESGELVLDTHYQTIPPSIATHIEGLAAQLDMEFSLAAAYVAFCAWPQIHGVIMLELFEHIGPVVGDVDTFYRAQMTHMFHTLGATITA